MSAPICSICEAPRHDGERYCRACRMRGYRRGARTAGALKERTRIRSIAFCETFSENGSLLDPEAIALASAVADLSDELARLS